MWARRYQIVATLDSRTSDICRHLDGKVFDMKDYEPGVTAPPFHVYCRSCTVPYFADNDENGMRAARTRRKDVLCAGKHHLRRMGECVCRRR